MADVLVLPAIATLVGLVLVWRFGRSPQGLLLGAFIVGLFGLVLTALLPWPTMGELLVFAAMGGMVGAAVVWFGRSRHAGGA